MNNGATERVVVLVDMDCFYCQVETRLNPTLKGKPLAVVQYNQWKGGGIIAVNYEARDKGVSRHMRGDEAKEICPEIILVPVPTIRGKADLSNYRDAGDEVAKVFSEFSDCVQRASIDEAYLDLTKAVEKYCKNQNEGLKVDDLPSTFVLGFCDLKNKNEEDRKKGLTKWLNSINNEMTKDSPEYQLAVGAKIVEEMRSEILKRTGFHCSAGIAHNKILAKLTAGLHKPKRQTVLPQDYVPELYETLPIYKVRNLGGKFGKQVADKLSIKYMSELFNFSLGELQRKFDEKTSMWLYNIARGIDLEPVTARLQPDSIGCCKNFPGKNALSTKSEVEHWLKELATEISERLYKDLKKNKRRAKLITVSFCQESPMTRCGALNSYEIPRIVSDALELLKKFNCASADDDIWTPPVKFLGLSASKFTEEISSIDKYLKNHKNSETSNKPKISLPSTSSGKTHESIVIKEHESIIIKEQIKKSDVIEENRFNKINKSDDEIEDLNKSGTTSPSFFLAYLNKYEARKNVKKVENSPENPRNEEKEGEAWISLSEVFPDVKQADREVVENLPEPLQKKFRERLSSAIDLENQEDLKSDPLTQTSQESRKSENNQEEEAWISLSEVFPDIKQAEKEVVENLPAPLQKKFREKLSSVTDDQEEKQSFTSKEIDSPAEPLTETCQECGKVIPVTELTVHSDYHAALKLYSEINKPIRISEHNVNKTKPKNTEGLTKRKKKGGVSPAKKMKSLTSFFTPLTKK